MNESRDVAAQIEQGVKLDGGLRGPEQSPREHGQAQVDRRSVESENGILEFHAEVFVGIERSCDPDQLLSELRMDPPVASLVGVGQRVARDRPANAHVVELVALRSQTDLDVAQTLPAGQLREGHAQELAHAREGLRVSVSAISPNTFAESVHRQMFHHLRENELACIHDRRTPGRGGQHRPKPPGRSSR